jgi:hypothetical protein
MTLGKDSRSRLRQIFPLILFGINIAQAKYKILLPQGDAGKRCLRIIEKRSGYLLKILKLSGIFVLVALLMCQPGYSDERFRASADFNLGCPRGEFKQNVDRAGIGGGGYFAYAFKNSPFSAGASIAVLVYGCETRPELLNVTVPEVVVDVTTRNYILMCHFVFRVQPPEGSFRPYVEGLAGFHYLWTETGIYDQGCCNESIASSVNLSDWTWSFGAGCGVSMKIYEIKKNGDKDPFAIFVDLGTRFIRGGKAEYLREGSIRRDCNRLNYDVEMSDTDFVAARLGLSFAF